MFLWRGGLLGVVMRFTAYEYHIMHQKPVPPDPWPLQSLCMYLDHRLAALNVQIIFHRHKLPSISQNVIGYRPPADPAHPLELCRQGCSY